MRISELVLAVECDATLECSGMGPVGVGVEHGKAMAFGILRVAFAGRALGGESGTGGFRRRSRSGDQFDLVPRVFTDLRIGALVDFQ